jgi:hypothetical protein
MLNFKRHATHQNITAAPVYGTSASTAVVSTEMCMMFVLLLKRLEELL